MRKAKKIILVVIIFVVLFVLILAFFPKIEKEYIYQTDFSELVEKNSEKYDIDKYLIFAVIKTESDFNENATSNVGARGLMQMMPDAFDWVKFKIGDERDITFDDMFTPEYNIEYGTFLLSFLLDRYDDKNLAIAAYHSGMGNVDKWLSDKDISSDGETIDNFPSKVTNHYVEKVLKAYESYKNLYKN